MASGMGACGRYCTAAGCMLAVIASFILCSALCTRPCCSDGAVGRALNAAVNAGSASAVDVASEEAEPREDSRDETDFALRAAMAAEGAAAETSAVSAKEATSPPAAEAAALVGGAVGASSSMVNPMSMSLPARASPVRTLPKTCKVTSGAAWEAITRTASSRAARSAASALVNHIASVMRIAHDVAARYAR